MSETAKIVFSLGVIIVVPAVAFLVLRRLYLARVAVWNEVLVPLGGLARPKVGLNAILSASVPLADGVTLSLEQWYGRDEHTGGHGQIVANASSSTCPGRPLLRWSRPVGFYVRPLGTEVAAQRWPGPRGRSHLLGRGVQPRGQPSHRRAG